MCKQRSWGTYDIYTKLAEILIQQNCLIHGFAHCSFVYSWKNYCGGICALQCSFLVPSHTLLWLNCAGSTRI
jgi:hypothetical protein